MKLYEATNEIKQLEKLVEEGELTQEQIQDTLEASEMSFNDKAVSIINLEKDWHDDVKVIDEHIKRLQDRKKAIKNNSQRLREYLRHNMIESGIKKISCPVFTIQLRKGQPKANILDADLLPDEYINTKVELKPDLNKIKADLKEGVEVTGAILEDGQDTLLIK